MTKLIENIYPLSNSIFSQLPDNVITVVYMKPFFLLNATECCSCSRMEACGEMTHLPRARFGFSTCKKNYIRFIAI